MTNIIGVGGYEYLGWLDILTLKFIVSAESQSWKQKIQETILSNISNEREERAVQHVLFF